MIFLKNIITISFLPILHLQSKEIGWQFTGNAFLRLQVPVFETVLSKFKQI